MRAVPVNAPKTQGCVRFQLLLMTGFLSKELCFSLHFST